MAAPPAGAWPRHTAPMPGGLTPLSSAKRAAEEAKLRDAFASLDKDGSGYIDASELGALLAGMGYKASKAEVAELLQLMDTDRNGVVDFEEFSRVLAGRAEDESVDTELSELMTVFQSFDMDSSGRLSVEELQRALKILGVKMSLDEAALLLKEVDTNGDGEVSYDEFVEFVLNYDEDGQEHSRP